MTQSHVSQGERQASAGLLAPVEWLDRGTESRRITSRRWRAPKPLARFAVLSTGRTTPRAQDSPIREGEPFSEIERREAWFRRSLAAADVLAAGAAVILSTAVLGHHALQPVALVVLPVIVVLVGKLAGLYDRDELVVNKTTIDEAPRLLQLATLYTLVFSVLQQGWMSGRLGALDMAWLWAAMSVLLVVARAGARAFAYSVTPLERCLFVGSRASADRLRDKLIAAGGHTVLVGRMSIGAELDGNVEEASRQLRRAVREMRIHRVVIEPNQPNAEVTLDLVREAKATGTRVSLLPLILEVVGSSIEIDDVHGLTLLGLRRFGLSRSSRILKRCLDLLGAVIGLTLLAPALAILALLIKLDSRGPVIYRQTRVGRDGQPFTMFKLRTMVDGADALKASLLAMNEANGLFKIAADPRITRVGKWLRRFSLDEVPQLVNVLLGEMSLVGPRPLVTDDDQLITGHDRRRLQLTPGMTGSWQILGSSRVPLAEMLKLDYLYVTGWSLWSDVKILLRTIPYVVLRGGM